jgi:hypothetical protein
VRRIQQAVELLGDVRDRLTQLEHDADLIKTVLIVKEPTSSLAADAYDGLRKQVIVAAGERRAHLSQLAQMDAALARGGSVEDARRLVRDWMQQAGVVAVAQAPDGTPVSDLFEVLTSNGVADGQSVEVVEPAYLDGATGAVLRLGRARPVALQPLGSPAGPPGPMPPSPNGEPVSDETDDAGPTPDHDPTAERIDEQQEDFR